MIIYQDCGNMTLQGRIYLLEGLLCEKMNDEYHTKYKRNLNGQVHGAIYYYYFGQNVDRCVNSKEKKKFIRGFAVYGKENEIEYKFKSGAFNKTGLQLKDKKYRELPPSEKQFIEYTLNQYWSVSHHHRHCHGLEFQVNFTEFEKYQDKKCKKLRTRNINQLPTVNEDVSVAESIATTAATSTQIADVAGYTVETLYELSTDIHQNHTYDFQVWKCNKKYKILKKIGRGATCIVYSASVNDKNEDGIKFNMQHNLAKNELVVIKQEKQHPLKNTKNVFINEYNILKDISSRNFTTNWTCKLFDFCIENDICHLVLSKLGSSLQQLRSSEWPEDLDGILNLNEFWGKMVCNIMIQMISALYKLHSIGYVHNDIKPNNILIGSNSNGTLTSKLHLIDFGLASSYWDFGNNKHMSIKTDVAFKGTLRFSSFNHHVNGLSQSRRDDLESLIYVGIYLTTEKLPWSVTHLCVYDAPFKEAFNLAKNVKRSTTIDDICKDCPPPFMRSLSYVKNLKFDEMPNYKYLKSMFESMETFNVKSSTQPESVEHCNGTSNYNRIKITDNSVPVFLGIRNKIDNKYSHDGNIRINIMAILNHHNDHGRLPVDLEDSKKYLGTHISAGGLRLRNSNIIESLTIKDGVPISRPDTNDVSYEGVVRYIPTKVFSPKLNGYIYMLSQNKCQKVKREYRQHNGKTFRGADDELVYYHYFGKPITSMGYGYQAQGFSWSSADQKFNFTGMRFGNVIHPESGISIQAKFIEYAINQYWKQSNHNGDETDNTTSKTIYAKDCFKYLMDSSDEVKSDDSVSKSKMEEIIIRSNVDQDDDYVEKPLVTGYNNDDMYELEVARKYTYVSLPYGVAVNILCYLDNKSQMRLFRLCSISNQLMKYVFSKDKDICYNLNAIWYWRKAKWIMYDKFTQMQIEKAYNDSKNTMVVLDKGLLYSNPNNTKFYKKYGILFEEASEKVTSTFNPKSYHSISNKQWKTEPFTKYFYQKQLVLKRYRIVKRVELIHES